jgi:hypothetical protein
MIHLKLFEVNSLKRSKQQWLELIQAQQVSDLLIIDFCCEQELPLNYFYARRSDLLKSKLIETIVNSSAFSKKPSLKYLNYQQWQSLSVLAKQPYLSQIQQTSFCWQN